MRNAKGYATFLTLWICAVVQFKLSLLLEHKCDNGDNGHQWADLGAHGVPCCLQCCHSPHRLRQVPHPGERLLMKCCCVLSLVIHRLQYNYFWTLLIIQFLCNFWVKQLQLFCVIYLLQFKAFPRLAMNPWTPTKELQFLAQRSISTQAYFHTVS